MIKNERQFKITNSWLRKFSDSLKEVKKKKSPEVHPLMIEAETNAIKSQIKEFRQDIREYNRLKTGNGSRINSIYEIGAALVKARIMNNLTQEQLGEKVGMAAQQIQRYEENNYSNAALHTIIEIGKELNLSSTKVSIFLNTTN